jgi:hypothetical protein
LWFFFMAFLFTCHFHLLVWYPKLLLDIFKYATRLFYVIFDFFFLSKALCMHLFLLLLLKLFELRNFFSGSLQLSLRFLSLSLFLLNEVLGLLKVRWRNFLSLLILFYVLLFLLLSLVDKTQFLLPYLF